MAHLNRILSQVKLVVPHCVLELPWAHRWSAHLIQWRTLNLFHLIVFNVLLELLHDLLLLLLNMWENALLYNSWYFCSRFASILSWSSLLGTILGGSNGSYGLTSLSSWWSSEWFLRILVDFFLWVIIEFVKILLEFRLLWTQFLVSFFFSWWLLFFMIFLNNKLGLESKAIRWTGFTSDIWMNRGW